MGSSSRRGLVQLTVAGVLWGTIGIVVRLLQDAGFSSTSIAFWRFVCACLVLVPLLARLRQLRTLVAAWRRPGRLLAVAASSIAFQLLYFFAVRDVGAGVATLVTLGLAPVVLHVTEAVAGRALPSRWTLVVLVTALAGLVLVASGSPSQEVAPRPLLGLALAVASGLTYAASTSWSAPLTMRVGPLVVTLVSSVLGALVLLPLVAAGGWSVPRTGLAIGGILWLGLVTTVVAYGLFYAGLRSTVASTAMIITLLEPVTALVLASLLLAEPLTLPNVLGGALLLSAVVLLYRRPPGG